MMSAHPRWRRALLTLGEIWLWGSLLILSLLLALFVMLGQGKGSPLIRDVLKVLNKNFQGRLEVDNAQVFLDGTVVVHGARLYDPKGALIAEVGELKAHIDLKALLRQELLVTAPRVSGLVVHLATQADGSFNLASAFAPRHPSAAPPKPSKPGGGFAISVEGAVIDAREISFTNAGDPQPLGKLTQAHLLGRLEVDQFSDITILADIPSAAVSGPVSGPLTLHGRMAMTGSRLTGSLTASLADASLAAAVDVDLATLSGHVSAPDITVGPQLLRTFLPDLKPKGAHLSLAATLTHGLAHLDSLLLRPLSGHSQLAVTGDIGIATGDGDATLEVSHLDAVEFLGAQPNSDLNLDLSSRFQTLFADNRAATTHLVVGPSTWAGQGFGPGRLSAERRGPRVALHDVDLAFPGGRIVADGLLVGKHLDASATLTVSNLEKARVAAERTAHVNLPDVSGSLSADIDVEGALDDLALSANVKAPKVELNGFSVEDFSAQVQAPQLGKQIDLHANLLLGRFQVADQDFHNLALTVDWTSPHLTLLVGAIQQGQKLVFWTRLDLPANLESANIEELEISLPTGEWQLVAPSLLTFKEGVAVHGLRLASDEQQLGVDIQITPRRTHIEGALTAFDLSRIPKTLLKNVALAGRVTGSGSYDEAHKVSEAGGEVLLTDFAYQGLSIPRLHLKGGLRDGALNAQVDGEINQGTLKAEVQGPLPGQPGTLQATVDLQNERLENFHSVVPALKPYHGTFGLNLAVRGSWNEPLVDLQLEGQQISGPWVDPTDANAALGVLSTQLKLQLGESETKMSFTVHDRDRPDPDAVALKFSAKVGGKQLGPLLVRSPAQATALFQRAPFSLTLDTAALPLAALGRVVPALAGVTGSLQLAAALNGSVQAPRGVADLHLRDVVQGERRLGNVALGMSSRDDQVNLHATVNLPSDLGGGGTLGVHWQLPLEQLRDARLRTAAAVTAGVDLRDLPLAALLGPESTLSGKLNVNGSLRGSLGKPAAKMAVALADLQVGNAPAGTLGVKGSWDGAQAVADVTGAQPKGGTLEAHARLPVTLAGLGDGPLTGSLMARDFDLAVAEAPLQASNALRRLAGKINAELNIGGTRSAPKPQGTLALSKGEVALSGLGDFQHIELQAALDPNGFELQQLSLTSGGGTLKAHVGLRKGADGFDLNGHFDTHRFGVYIQDKLQAFLTSAADLSGQFGKSQGEVTLTIASATADLPPLLSQKSYGPVSLDPDIRVGTAKAKRSAPSGPGYPIFFRAVTARAIHITGQDADLYASVNLAVRLANETAMKGNISVLEGGTVSALGRTFKLQRGLINFGDPNSGDFAGIDSATIDVAAAQDIGDHRVMITVLGNLTDPEPHLSSEPPAPPAAVALLIISGGSDSSQAAGDQQGGLSLAGDVLGEAIHQSLGPNVPLDVITLEPNRQEIGKRLTPKLYVGVIRNQLSLIDPRINPYEVHSSYDLGHRLSLDGRYGTAQAGALDLVLRHNW